jgi:lysozyme family protein
MDFDAAFGKLMVSEGGYINHPSDPGGETNHGITARVAIQEGYTGRMRDLPLATAKTIARKRYWDAVRCDELPPTLRYPMLDAAYHSGPTQAIRWLQRAVGTVDDGKLGPITLAAANRAGTMVAPRMLAERLDFLTNLPTWGHFGKGWSRRIASVLKEATA